MRTVNCNDDIGLILGCEREFSRYRDEDIGLKSVSDSLSQEG